MKLDKVRLEGLRFTEGFQDTMNELKQLFEQRINLTEYSDYVQPVKIQLSPVMRICLMVGLSDPAERDLTVANSLQIAKNTEPLPGTFFTKGNTKDVISTLIKLRYHDVDAEWESSVFMSKLVAQEMLRGKQMLMKEGAIDDWLLYAPRRGGKTLTDIPELNLNIGKYENGMDALLDINSRQIANTQILVAGTTGSGKSNLLSVLLNQIRTASADTHYPVNFLLFDYKGEFSDPMNASWLQKFEVDQSCLLDPIRHPLPFTPFKDFTGRPINEVNLYATSLATALQAISRAQIGANMNERLSRAVIEAYKSKEFAPITFSDILDEYVAQLPENKRDSTDSIISVLNQLVRNNIFADKDEINLLNDSYIINLAQFPKEDVMAKAIVYFVIAKLNNIYEQLEKQAVNDERVEIRHFTIIDEAHYMLGFENKPLQNLIAVGRNKGMSIILATQNMEQFKSKFFDFYANAQYPLLMRQQQQNDQILKDLFGVNGVALQELKAAIAGLQKGELITKDATNMALGLGKHWKKIKVTHLI